MMKDNVVLVTGAAMGIGEETAYAFSRKGAKLVISDIDKDELKKTEEVIRGRDGEVFSVVADISKEKDIKKLIDKAIDHFGAIDIAVNNAGISGGSATTSQYEVDEWDRVLNINLRGQFLCMKYEIEAMLENGSGSIVNLASILGKVGFNEAPAYVASKHALIGLTKTAALEYSAQGIRVNAVCPGFIDTPMLENAGITSDEETKNQITALHPIGRLGTPQEVAEAIVWISSDKASFVTGHSLMVDGGYTAR